MKNNVTAMLRKPEAAPAGPCVGLSLSADARLSTRAQGLCWPQSTCIAVMLFSIFENILINSITSIY